MPVTDLHEWISFEDPHEDRTWIFDVTFLLSSWSCIYGNGCLGVLTGPAPELAHGCCSYGAHFIDDADLAEVELAVERLRPDQWQHHRKAARGGWLRTDDDSTRITRVVDGACIFLNHPGFPGGPGCSLHQAAIAAGERALDWKPDVCWQLPLRQLDHVDENGHVTSTLREWKRRDWGEGGQEFHWWCTEGPEAFVGTEPVYRYLADEIRAMVGDHIYDLMADQLAQRARRTVLPHPAVRR